MEVPTCTTFIFQNWKRFELNYLFFASDELKIQTADEMSPFWKKNYIANCIIVIIQKKVFWHHYFFYHYYSCPFDAVTIYDGPDNMAEKIGTYCGQMRNLVIFSTQNKLYITFTTLKRTAPAQNRGFFAIYEFSESFVKLGKYRFFFFFELLFVVGAKNVFPWNQFHGKTLVNHWG